MPTSTPIVPERRDALYYPYIHIRDEAWLKATLLCFPHVVRMTPPNFPLNDSAFVRELTDVTGAHGEAMVGRYDLNSLAAYTAAKALAERLERDLETDGARMHERFSRHAASRDFGGNDSAFQIHEDKIAYQLAPILERAGLIWSPSTPNRSDLGWRAVHPTLGEALMSTLAVAAAREIGAEIVTSDSTVHHAVATNDEAAIYDALIRGVAAPRPAGAEDLVTPIAHAVIVNNFDLSKLTPKDLASMSRDGEGLYAFRAEVAQIAAGIPAMTDRVRLEKRMKEAEARIIERWQESRSTMTSFTKRLFGGDAARLPVKPIEKFLEASLPALVSGGTTAAAAALMSPALLTAVLPGLAVAIVVHGVTSWHAARKEKKADPLRYLSHIERAGAAMVVSPLPAGADRG